MKGFVVILFCVFAAIQARSTGVQSKAGTAAALGENPWVVHLRIAVSTSGLLNSCVGTLHNEGWILTAASCVEDARYVWVRYGAVDVIQPELVTERPTVHVHPHYDPETGENDIALLSINRVVHSTDNVSNIPLADSDADIPSSGKFCGYGGSDNVPGEQLVCEKLSLEATETGTIVANGESTKFDLGAPLVSDGVMYGILVSAGETSVFLNTAPYQKWIEGELTARATLSVVDA